MTTTGKQYKSQKVLDYFKFKASVNAHGFISLIKDIPTVDFKSPHEGQWPIIHAYEERVPPSPESVSMGLTYEYRYRVIVAACGRRFGKSEIAAVLGAQELLIPNAQVMIVSYELKNCEVIFKKIYKIICGLGIKMRIDRQQDMELELVNGSTLRVASNDNVKSKLGSAISLLIMDEAKLFDRALYEQVLMPMLFDYSPYSRTILISSPEENNWFEAYYERGQSDDPRWGKYWSCNQPTHTNPTIPREELIEMEATMPPDLYAQEVLGQFISAAGLVCNEFDKKEHLFDFSEFPEWHGWLQEGNVIVQSIDSGYSHYFASVWFLYVPDIDTFFVFAEYTKNKTITAEHAETIKSIEQEWGAQVYLRYADPAASQQIADFTLFDLYYNKAEKQLKETVNCINTLLFQRSEQTGKPKLLIHKDCKELTRQLSSCIWKRGKDDLLTKEQSAQGMKPFMPDREGKTDWDLFDALRYGLYSFAKNQRVGVSVFNYDLESEEENDPFETAMRRAGWMPLG